MRILRRFLARVKNFAMGQRSREFGIRIAVGATRGNVIAVVFHQGLVLTLIATSVGVGAALPALEHSRNCSSASARSTRQAFARLSFCWD